MLDKLRIRIDEIDEKMIALYEERMEISQEVGEYKHSIGRNVFDRERELQKLKSVETQVHTEVNRVGVRELYEHIMSVSRKIQYEIVGQEAGGNGFQFTKDVIGDSPKVVFQGVKGAYSQKAMQEYFGQDVEGAAVVTFRDAMEAIANGEADFAVLPIENSSAGAVTQVYDLLVEYDNYIIGEVVIPIEHALASVKGATVEGIKTVYSHPQALMQSQVYLEQHRGMEQISVGNTAIAAQMVVQENDIEKAAVCSEYAAGLYGLEILERKINHSENNSTRFIVISKTKKFHENAKKLSICFEIPHESGSLYRLLSHFIYNGLNMTKIESRPIEGRVWEYRFFVDIEGNLEQQEVSNAVRGISEEAINMKILGNY